MSKIVMGCILTLLTAQVAAQTVSATIRDSVTNSPVSFVTASIRRLDGDSASQSTVSDEKGRVRWRKMSPGNFELTLTSVGYKATTIPVTIGSGARSIDLGTLFLTPRTDLLKEVLINSKRALIEERLDRTVYNVESDKSLTGGDATDALRRVPLLSVDIDGNVTLRGSANFKILVNGKPSTITANNLASALKQIPVDQIKSVEVITSPSVKYDADGSAGIINIMLKRDRLHGILLNPDMAIGTRASFLGIDGAYNDKKTSISIGGFGRATYNVTGIYHNRQTVNGETIDQRAATRKNELTDNYNIGWEYDMDKSNFLNASARYSQFNSHIRQNDLLTNFYKNGVLDSTTQNQVEITSKSATIDATLDYTHAFAKPRQELSFLTLFSRTNGTNSFTGNNDINSNQEITFQVDYQTPLDSNRLLEFGAKYIIREVTSDFKYPAVDRFIYHQNVTAGYLEYTWNTHTPFSVRTGVRYEYTVIGADLRDLSMPLPPIPSYAVFVPAVNLGWRLKNGKLIKLAYTRRIQRPSIRFLNPNWIAPDPGSIATGNPALGPEFSDNIELGYSTALRKMSIGFSAFYRHTKKAIESISVPLSAGDTIEQTFANIGQEHTGGLNIFGDLNIGQKLDLNAGLDVYYSELDNDFTSARPSVPGSSAPGSPAPGVAGHNSGWVIGARLSGGYTFVKGWSLYLYSYFRGSQVLLQGYQTGYPYYSLTLKHGLRHQRGTIGLGAENFITRGFPVSTKTKTATLFQTTSNLNHTLSLRLYMSLTIGKLKVERNQRQQKSVSNDDLKKG
jgi:outer membrane receptor protein involved in Fe transport